MYWLLICVFGFLETDHKHVFWDAKLWHWNSECTSGASVDVVVSVCMSTATWHSAGIHFHVFIKKPSSKIRTTDSFTSNMHLKIILLWSTEVGLDYFYTMHVTMYKCKALGLSLKVTAIVAMLCLLQDIFQFGR